MVENHPRSRRKCRSGWTCGTCTFQNLSNAFQCEMCNQEKGGLANNKNLKRPKVSKSSTNKKNKKLKSSAVISKGDLIQNQTSTNTSPGNSVPAKENKTATSFDAVVKLIKKNINVVRKSEFLLESYRSYKAKHRKHNENPMHSPEAISAFHCKQNAMLRIRYYLIKCASFYGTHVPLKDIDEDGIKEENIFCAKCSKSTVSPRNDIILCDGVCSRAYHQLCDERQLGNEDIIDDDWFCLQCDVIMETLDHLGEILFDDKCHYSLHSYNDIYKLILPDHAIFKSKEHQACKSKLVGLTLLRTKCKKKNGLLVYTDDDKHKIVNYDVENDKFTIERCVESPNGTQSTLITSDELSLEFKRAPDEIDIDIESNSTQTSKSTTVTFLDMEFPEDDSGDEDYRVPPTKSNSKGDGCCSSDSEKSSSDDDGMGNCEENEEIYIVAGRSLRRRKEKIDYKKLAGEMDEDNWGDSLLDGNYDPSSSIQNEDDEIAEAIRQSLLQQ